MLYQIPLPNGVIVEMEAPENREQEVKARARQYFQAEFPDEFQKWRESRVGVGRSLTSGFGSAVDQAQGALYSAAEGLGQITNLESLRQFGREGRLRNAAEAEQAFPSQLRTPILEAEGAGDIARGAAEIVAGSAPQSAVGIGGALAGARLGAAGGARGRIIGGLLGGAAAAYPFLAGGNIQRQIEEEAKARSVAPAKVETIPSPGAAFTAAVPQAALESAADVATLGTARLLRKPVQEAAGTLGQRLLRGAGVGALGEALVEPAQALIERGQAGLPLTDAEAGREYLESAVGGAIGGGVTGGITRAAFGARPAPAPLPELTPPPGFEQPIAPAPAEAAPVVEGEQAPTVAAPAAPVAEAPAYTPPPPLTLPERPRPFASVAETETFLAENPQFTPPVTMPTPEAATAFVNAARVAEWQRGVNESRQQAIDEFVGIPAAVPEGETAPSVNRQDQATQLFGNMATAAGRGDINLNAFTPDGVAKAALGSRDIDPGRISKDERKAITTELEALVKAGYLSKPSPKFYAVTTQPRPAPAQEAQQEPAVSPEIVRRIDAQSPQAAGPVDEGALWRGYSLNAGPQSSSPIVAEARNIAAIRRRPFTRPELSDFSQQISAATPETRSAIINDFINAPRPAAPAGPAAPPPQAEPQTAPLTPPPKTSAENTVLQGPAQTTPTQEREVLEKQYTDSISNPIFKYFTSPIMSMAKIKPIFKIVSDAMKRLYTRTEEATTNFAELMEPASRLPEESRAKIALAMQEARSRQQMPNRDAFTAEEYAAMESLFEAGQRAYDYFIDSYTNKYYDPNNAKTPEERARLEAFQQQKGNKLLTDMDPEVLHNASPNGFREIQTYNNMRDPFYFPQIGLGTHFVAAYRKLPGNKKEIVRIYFYNPLKAAQRVRGFQDPEARAINYLRQEFNDPNQFIIMDKGVQAENDANAQQVRKDGDFIAQYLQRLNNVSTAEGKRIIEQMSSEINKAKMDRIFRPNKDILRAVTPDNAAEYIMDVLPKYFLSAAKIQAREYIRDDFARGVEPLTPNDRAYWNDLLNYATVPSEAFGTARALAFFMYLGAALDTALINMTQGPFVAYPRLLRDGGAEASKYYGSALKTSLGTLDVGKLLKRDLAYTDSIIQKRILNKDEIEALRLARSQGIFTPIYTNESRGQVSVDTLRSLGIKNASNAAKGINTLTDYAGRFMQAAEEFNRLSTFVAAYRMAKANPSVMQNANRVDNTTYSNPYDYAAGVVFDTQFITSKEDRALIQRFTPAAEVATQFMSFPLKMVEMYARHGSMLVRGLAKGDPVLAKAGAVMLAGLLTPLITVAGIWALPFADSLREIVERLIKQVWGDPVNFKVEIEKMLDGNRFASIINNGVPHAYNVMSLQKRLAIDPVPAEDLLSFSTLSLFGPVGGLAEKFPVAAQYYGNGDYWGLAATMLPRAVGNVVKGAQFAFAEEQWSRRGTRTLTPEQVQAEGGAAIRQALGFPPPEFINIRERIGRQQELDTQMQKATEKAHKELARIQLRIFEARRENDTAKAAEAARQFRERAAEITRENEGKPWSERVILNFGAVRERAIKDFEGRGAPQVLFRETRTQARPQVVEELRRQGQLPSPGFAEGGLVASEMFPEREPYESELQFFEQNPNVTGMATEDNKVIVNPFSKISAAERESLVLNERARLAMRQGLIDPPNFVLTPEQMAFFSRINNGRPYGNPQEIKETLAARILSGDPSAQRATKSQLEYVNELRRVLNAPE